MGAIVIDWPAVAQQDALDRLHLAITLLKAAWNAISEIEQIFDSETVGTDEVKAAMLNLDAAVSELAGDVETGRIHSVTLEDLVAMMTRPREKTAEVDRLEKTLKAIQTCELTGVDFGDFVQEAVTEVLAGGWPECWKCGTVVHDGPCVGDGDEAAV